jgi:23S rRNA pseudouridine2605 synthase
MAVIGVGFYVWFTRKGFMRSRARPRPRAVGDSDAPRLAARAVEGRDLLAHGRAEWIRAGRVASTGARPRSRRRVVPERRGVTLDGRRIGAVAQRVLGAPQAARFVTTRQRSRRGGGPCTTSSARLRAWAIAVGRLDRDTSGLLLFTNDTQFAERVTNPTSHVPKTYRVDREAAASRTRARETARGSRALGRPDASGSASRGSATADRATVLELTISEGRNRRCAG